MTSTEKITEAEPTPDHGQNKNPERWQFPPLEPLQRAAVNAAEGPVVLVGGPGTGKTHTLSARAVALAKATGSPQHVTVVAFNSRASRSVRKGLDAIVGGDSARAGFYVATIHRLCSFLLRQVSVPSLGIAPNFSLWNSDQTAQMLAEILRNSSSSREDDEPAATPVLIREISHWYSLHRNLDQPGDEPPRDARWWDYIEEYTRQKRLQNALDFDDLIVMAAQLLQEYPAVRASWNTQRTRHLLVDEFQDTTPLCYRLLSLLQGPTQSWTISADPNQAIYTWRGADPALLERFIRQHPNLETHTLLINHRATGRLINAGVAVHEHPMMSGLSPDRQTGIRGQGPSNSIRYMRTEKGPDELYSAIAAEVQRLVDDENIKYSDVGLIYRRKTTGPALELKLNNQMIPNVVLGASRETTNQSVRSVLALLTLVTNPYNAIAFRLAADPNIFKEHPGLNPKVSRDITDLAQRFEVDIVQAARVVAPTLPTNLPARHQLDYLVNIWDHLQQKLDLEQLSPSELVQIAYTRMCEASTSFEVTTLSPPMVKLMLSAERYEHPTQADARGRLNGFLEYMASSLHPELAEQDNSDPLAYQTGVALGTIHAAKGLQFYATFVVDLIDDYLPGDNLQPGIGAGHRRTAPFLYRHHQGHRPALPVLGRAGPAPASDQDEPVHRDAAHGVNLKGMTNYVFEQLR